MLLNAPANQVLLSAYVYWTVIKHAVWQTGQERVVVNKTTYYAGCWIGVAGRLRPKPTLSMWNRAQLGKKKIWVHSSLIISLRASLFPPNWVKLKPFPRLSLFGNHQIELRISVLFLPIESADKVNFYCGLFRWAQVRAPQSPATEVLVSYVYHSLKRSFICESGT